MSKRPKNQAPNREITDLRARLRLPETRAQTIKRLAELYAQTGTIALTAEVYGVSRETLTRCVADYPELKTEIDRIRESKLAVKG
jgi:AraC-like DNA-binding protein